MKEYELCIRDITRAFDNSYPNNLVNKYINIIFKHFFMLVALGGLYFSIYITVYSPN